MTWAGILAAIDADLVAAGATLTPTLTAIRYGQPPELNTDVIWYEFGGDRESTTGGNTLGKVNIEEGVTVVVALRASANRSADLDAVLETRLHDAVRAIKAALWGDWSLGGNAIAVKLDQTATNWEVIAATLARTATFTLWVDEAEVSTLAP